MTNDNDLDLSMALSLRGVSKTFGSFKALDSVGLDVAPGSVHAVVGQNGSGKSTLIKVLSGYHRPDAGADGAAAGERLSLGEPPDPRFGLRFVHQDLGLIDTLSVVDNLALARGYLVGSAGWISPKVERERSRRALAELDIELDLRVPVGALIASERLAVCVARALEGWGDGEVRVLVLDEPTAALPEAEVETLFALLDRVRAAGIATVFVSHHLDEIFAIADTVTVLRDSRVIGTHSTGELTHERLVELMVGRPLEPQTTEGERQLGASTRLRVEKLTTRSLRGIEFSIDSGEVVGVAGLTGSGRDELANSIFGLLPREGTVLVNGSTVPPMRPEKTIAAGAALIPADRAQHAVVPNLPVSENLTLPGVSRFFKAGWMRRRAEREEARVWLERLDIGSGKADQLPTTLSGGNQQKLVLGRWLRMNPPLMILDQPTQGVDISAKLAIYDLIKDAVVRGAAVLVCSTDSDELAFLCDRVLVLYRGQVAAQLRADGIEPDRIDAETLGPGVG